MNLRKKPSLCKNPASALQGMQPWHKQLLPAVLCYSYDDLFITTFILSFVPYISYLIHFVTDEIAANTARIGWNLYNRQFIIPEARSILYPIHTLRSKRPHTILQYFRQHA